MKEDFYQEYEKWKEMTKTATVFDQDIINELNLIQNDNEKIKDAFYCNLAFGTGGLRGVIGAGTNRMNVYTVARASQGLSNYIKKHFSKEKRFVAISYDSRIKSDLFAKVAAGVFAENGINVYIYSQLMPTPCLSYAVRFLKCAAGIMVTASHNPSNYNGYKVYGKDGCQITKEAANEIWEEMEKIDVFDDINVIPFEIGVSKKSIQYIPEEVYTNFVEQVKKQSVLNDRKIDRNIAIIYTPLNGTGLTPVLQVLRESGYSNIRVVEEQKNPDGVFPTCPYPNPEVKDAMELGIEYAQKYNADLLLATDPDCDRVGIAVRNRDSEYILLTGNETGVLLLDYICSQRLQNKMMPKDPVFIKSIVTTDLAEQIASSYGVSTINVLTGFKYIGEQIGRLEKEGKVESYIFGFEESYGYLTGSYVRDKDGVNGAFMICEMFVYYASQGISLLEKLNQLYEKYGYYLNSLHSYQFEGYEGFKKMNNIMKCLQNEEAKIGKLDIVKVLNYNKQIDNLPKSNVLKFMLKNDCSLIVRPSGTEPKLKIYTSVRATSKEAAKEKERWIVDNFEKILLANETKNNS